MRANSGVYLESTERQLKYRSMLNMRFENHSVWHSSKGCSLTTENTAWFENHSVWHSSKGRCPSCQLKTQFENHFV